MGIPVFRKEIFLCLLFLAVLVAGWAHGDEVTIKTENGVTVVYNPKNPAPPPGIPTKLVLKEELSIGEKEGREEEMLYEPREIDADEDGNIYILDRKAIHIKVFDSRGKFVRTIGKKGQGPGEFENPSGIRITPQKEILVCDPRSRRVLFFSVDGQFLRQLLAGEMWMFTRAKVDSKGNIVGSHTIMDKVPKTELLKFNAEMEPLFTIASMPIARYPDFNPYFPFFFYEVTEEDNILWGKTTEYEFRILSPEGKLVKRIVKDYDPEKLTREDREKRAKEIWGDAPPSASDVRVKWPKNFPAFQECIMDDRGWLFVRTYEKTKDPEGSYYDVFDNEGRYIAKVFLTVRPRLLKAGKLYAIEEDEEGFLTVKRYRIDWK